MQDLTWTDRSRVKNSGFLPCLERTGQSVRSHLQSWDGTVRGKCTDGQVRARKLPKRGKRKARRLVSLAGPHSVMPGWSLVLCCLVVSFVLLPLSWATKAKVVRQKLLGEIHRVKQLLWSSQFLPPFWWTEASDRRLTWYSIATRMLMTCAIARWRSSSVH